MAIAIFPTVARIERTYQPNRGLLQVGAARFAQSATEQRWGWDDREFDTIICPIHVTAEADRATFDTFIRDVGSSRDSFHFTDGKTHTSTALAMGTATASQTVFTIPSPGVGAGFYPVSVATVTLYDDGSPINVTAVGVDARTITTDAVVAVSSVMTADFSNYYRRVRFGLRNGVGPWQFMGGTKWGRNLVLQEVPA